ncbi:MAG: hypothetical protein D6731_00325 [Planctomycetota bacterium]|nr:MAG: hypothetical protein D6731_00325 [Planctomycetota bacterium]
MAGPGRRPNHSLLFSPDSDLDLLFAVLGLIVLLALTVGPALQELAEERPGLALGLLALAGLPALVNLLRYRRAPWGCAVLPAGFLLYGLAFAAGLSGVVRTLLLAAPNVLFLFWDGVLRAVRGRVRAAQALQDVARAAEPTALLPYLADRDARVAAAAAEALGRFSPEEARDALQAAVAGEDLALARAAARALPAVAADPKALDDAAADSRPEVRLALAEGLLHARGGDLVRCARLLAELLGADDESVRQGALDAFDAPAAPAEQVAALAPLLRAALREALSADAVASAERLWALGEVGAAEDAELVAEALAASRPEVIAAAVHALSSLAGGGDAAIRARAASALEAAHARLRGEHPLGENPIADRLCGELESLATALARRDA